MSTGMDALESVGRKTMDILSEGDPMLKRKREMFIKEHPTLSQVRAGVCAYKGQSGSQWLPGVEWEGGRSLACFQEIN